MNVLVLRQYMLKFSVMLTTNSQGSFKKACEVEYNMGRVVGGVVAAV